MDAVIADIIARGGYIGIVILMAIENIFPPFPSEAIMGAGALAVTQGKMNFWPLFLAGTFGSTLGNYFWFYIGDRWGYERMKPFVDRNGRWLTMEWEDVERAARLLQQYGHFAVFILRATPIMRTMISLPAGLAHMGAVKFVLYTVCGVAVWNLMLIFGTQWLVRTFDSSGSIVSFLVIGFSLAAVLGYMYRVARWKPRSER